MQSESFVSTREALSVYTSDSTSLTRLEKVVLGKPGNDLRTVNRPRSSFFSGDTGVWGSTQLTKET